MRQGILYGVGVGPGDPELLTLKAVRVLQDADMIAVPDTGKGEKTALGIVEDYVRGKELFYCAAPMCRDKARLAESYDAAADALCILLETGKTVAFITLGDPAVYSTYMYVHRRVVRRGYRAEMIPGVPSFCAAAALLGESLCEGGESLLIVPASYEKIDACLDFSGNKVLMKTGRAMGGLKEKLRERGLTEAAMVSNCGMAGETVHRGLAEINEDAGYFSLVFVKE